MSADTAAPVINSPCCRRPFDLSQPGEAFCFACHTKYALTEFPALRATRVVPRARAADTAANDATCFFHAQNQADTLCDSCGRFLCNICAVAYGGRTLCPACIAAAQTAPDAQSAAPAARPVAALTSQWNPDGIALLLATLPILTCIFTLVTAPAALVIVALNWKTRPPFPVRRVRWQRWLAAALAIIQIALWTLFIVNMVSLGTFSRVNATHSRITVTPIQNSQP